ncbi:LLM class flavin-dependent oxidoreductase [Lentzea sp. NPDC006480]|uniref:LLM class flavin-dependent oxidoreductase n=1 Tax=Lentzea sp. NPDC006480 TaxID=3157176 RepID=UPI00339FF720
MRLGMVAPAGPGVEDLAARAEELGSDSFWLYDTPMAHGDPFVFLSLCAAATIRIKLGIGVTSPSLRAGELHGRAAGPVRRPFCRLPRG